MSYISISRNGSGVRRKVTLWCYKGWKKQPTETTEEIYGSTNFGFRAFRGVFLRSSRRNETLVIDLDGEERWFCPDNRTLALQGSVRGEVDTYVQDRVGGNRFICVEQDSRPADIHGLRLNPVRHSALAEVKWNRQRESLRAIRKSMSGISHFYCLHSRSCGG